MGVSGTYVSSSTQLSSFVVTNSKLGKDIAISGSFATGIYAGTVVNGTWAWQLDNAGAMFNSLFQNFSSATVNDEFTLSIPLPAGTYNIYVFALSSTDYGQIEVSLNGGGPLFTLDGYAAAPAYNKKGEALGETITTNGVQTISFKVAGKNGASSGYKAAISALIFVKV